MSEATLAGFCGKYAPLHVLPMSEICLGHGHDPLCQTGEHTLIPGERLRMRKRA